MRHMILGKRRELPVTFVWGLIILLASGAVAARTFARQADDCAQEKATCNSTCRGADSSCLRQCIAHQEGFCAARRQMERQAESMRNQAPPDTPSRESPEVGSGREHGSSSSGSNEQVALSCSLTMPSRGDTNTDMVRSETFVIDCENATVSGKR